MWVLNKERTLDVAKGAFHGRQKGIRHTNKLYTKTGLPKHSKQA